MSKKKKNKSYVVRNLKQRETFKYKLIIEGALIGVLVGFVIAMFRLLLIQADRLRNFAVSIVQSGSGMIIFVALCLIVIAGAITWLLKFEPDISGSGIPQIEGELKGLEDQNWSRVLFAKFIGCILAIGGGLALGREGPSIQLGGMIGKGAARKKHALLTEERMLMSCGAGAGLSAAFGAPLAGVLFTLEELHKNFSGEVLISAMASCAVSDYIAVRIVGLAPVFNFEVEHRIPLRLYWSILLLGIVLGVAGFIYNQTLDKMQNFFAGFNSNFLSLAFMMMISLLLMYAYPTVLGSGNELVSEISKGKFTLGALSIMLIAKFAFSAGSFGTGTPGGIFLPLLVIGSIIGGFYSTILTEAFGISPEYLKSFVIIAMAGFFSAIVRAPITGVILITEMTGNFATLLSLVTASLVAYVVADLLGGEPVYDQLLNRRLRVKSESGEIVPDKEYITDVYNKKNNEYVKKKVSVSERKVVIDSSVYYGSHMDGREVMELNLPKGSLIVSVMRHGEEIIPGGATRLYGGDDLEILCRLRDIAVTEAVLDEKCKAVEIADNPQNEES